MGSTLETLGLESLKYKSINSEKGLYMNLYRHGITQSVLLRILGLTKIFKEFKSEWSWERVLAEAGAVTEKQGFLPPGQWFHDNGQGTLVNSVYNLGRTWADLRSEWESFQSSSFVQSRNGMRWRSHPEASLSNFLYTRGITQRLGRKYPKEYTQESGLGYGYYDLGLLSVLDEWIDVEIWGEKPYGHQEEYYAEKRGLKETFNASNPNFLGIEFRDCYSEDRLAAILEPYVGIIVPYIFDKPSDTLIPATHWSNSDELLDYCREFAKNQPGGKFPTEEWLRKRGKWKDRPGIAYNTLTVYIKLWVGGIRNLRQIIGQPENSTTRWNREMALNAYGEWYEIYKQSTGAVRKMHQRGQIDISEAELKRAGNIGEALEKYVGSVAEVHQILGLPLPRNSWSSETALDAYLEWYETYNEPPETSRSKHRRGRVQLTEAELSRATSIAQAARKHVGNVTEVHRILGLTMPRNTLTERSCH